MASSTVSFLPMTLATRSFPGINSALLDWQQLVLPLQQTNIATRCNLLFVSAACWGHAASLFQAGGLLTIAVFGTYTKDNGFHDDLGKTLEFATSNGAVPLDKGMYFEKEVDALPMIDDNLMTSMLQAREK